MARRLLDLRLQFLDQASKDLLGPSPAISAHLQTVRESISRGKGEVYHSSRTPSCTACGILLLRGWSCESISNAPTRRTRKERLAKKAVSTRIVKLRCHKCNSTTTIEDVSTSSEDRIPHETLASSADVMSAPTTADPPKTTSTSESLPRQAPRKRPRSKKSTLQSMVANRKLMEPNMTGDFGLDLMDIMKP